MNEVLATSSSQGTAASGGRVDACLSDFLASKILDAEERCLSVEVTQALRDFVCVSGGRRVRPELCVAAWSAAAGGGPAPAPVVRAAASLELFHAFALIHDDFMDRSATRRGRPALHRLLADRHGAARSATDAGHVGASAAILTGNLALAWSDELLHTAGLTPDQLLRILPLVAGMRERVLHGQYLDITATGPVPEINTALHVARCKTGSYTCEHPLQVGATLAGASGDLLEALSAFARPLGEAFQLCDDLLGVFGDPAATGKPVLDDLREGRHTVLLALAWQRATPGERGVLRAVVGKSDITEEDALRVREILTATGARYEVGRMIANRRREALDALRSARLPADVVTRLARIADVATGFA
ncbi:polyprenyl synthetase family protein [Streptomyces sp. NPDC051173]|uniref:polyprenyl synthetase family protein n=1 Tax=Streptomyces sp. NPDC051173 TaxID=3155164 RepID=UPI00344E5129